MTPTWLAGPDRALTRFGEIPLFREGLYDLSRGCYAWMVPNGSWGETNIGLVDCGGKSVLIDTCWDLKFTQELLDQCSAILARSPVETVINTHSDGDHCWGNQLFAGREIIASNACIHAMHHVTPQSVRLLKSVSKVFSGLPVADIDKFGHYMHGMFAPYDVADIHLHNPTQGFSGERVLNVNGVDLVLTEVGPGHTDGDILVYLPDRKTLYAGDILFIGSTPVMWAGPLQNIIAGLRKVQALNAEIIVPGHGPLASYLDVQQVIDYWEFAETELNRRHRLGMTPHDAAADILLSPAFQSLPFARWDSPERLCTTAYTMYRNWGSSFKPLPGKLGQMDLFRRQAQIAWKMPHATPACMHGRAKA